MAATLDPHTASVSSNGKRPKATKAVAQRVAGPVKKAAKAAPVKKATKVAKRTKAQV